MIKKIILENFQYNQFKELNLLNKSMFEILNLIEIESMGFF